MKTIHILEEKECTDYCGIGGTNFKPEAYTSKETAEERLKQLETEEHNEGFYYLLREVFILD